MSLGRWHSHPLVWCRPRGCCTIVGELSGGWGLKEDEGALRLTSTHCWVKVFLFSLCAKMQGVVMEGRPVLLLSSPKDGWSDSLSVFTSVFTEMKTMRGVGRACGWPWLRLDCGHMQVFVSWTVAEADVCLSNTNSHKDMGKKCTLTVTIHINHCRSCYNYNVPSYNGMFLLECTMV